MFRRRKGEQENIRPNNDFSPGEGNGNPFQYSCLENPMDGGAWWSKELQSRARLSDFTFTFHCHALEKEMATHSSVPAWRIPGTGELGGLLSMGSHRVGHNWSDLAAAAVIYRNSGVRRIIEWSKASAQWNLHCQEGQIKKQIHISNMLDGSE